MYQDKDVRLSVTSLAHQSHPWSHFVMLLKCLFFSFLDKGFPLQELCITWRKDVSNLQVFVADGKPQGLTFFSRSNCSKLLSVSPSRRICCYDHSFPPEKKDWLFCYSNIPAMHNDRHSVPSLLLAQQRVCTSKDRLW